MSFFAYRARNRQIPLLALLAVALTAAHTSVAAAGGIDQLLRPQVLQLLKDVGLLDSSGAPVGASGFSNPATEDLDMDAHAITDFGDLTATAGFTLQAPTGNATVNALTGTAVLVASAGNAQVSSVTDDVNVYSGGGAYDAINLDNTLSVSEADAAVIVTGTLTVSSNATISGVTSATVSAQNLVWINGAATKTLTDAECKGQVWETTGAGSTLITFQLPDAPAVGDLVTFHVSASHTGGLKVLANTGDTIATEVQTTASAGYLLSTRPGSTLTIMRESATAWRALRVSGTWKVDSTSSVGYAYTPTPWEALTTITSTWVSNATFSGSRRHDGDQVEVQIRCLTTGAPTAASLTFSALNGPDGASLVPDEAKLLTIAGDSGGTSTAIFSPLGFGGMLNDDSAGTYFSHVNLSWRHDNNTWVPATAGISTTSAQISNTSPITFANHDTFVIIGRWPVP